MDSDERPGRTIPEAEAWGLLEHCHYGRLALSVANQPDIFPTNFLARDGFLLIRTNPGTKLAELTINDKVAFEADGMTSDEAWSVVVQGSARVLESRTEIEEADQLPLKPWIPTRKYTYVKITPRRVEGRRFELGPEPDRY